MLDRLSWTQRVAVIVLGTAAVVLIVLEGLSAPAVPAAVGLIVCGVLPVAALFLPSAHPGAITFVAVLSATFSVVCYEVLTRPDNTFGTVELTALSWLVVRVVIQQPPRRSIWLVPVLFVAIVLLPIRLDQDNAEVVRLAIPALGLGVAFLTLLGMYLRLHDRRRADADQLARQTQRLEYARDLHDFVAHHVTAIVAQAKAVRYASAAGHQLNPAELDGMLANIEKAGSQALVSMRGMVTSLRGDPPVRPQQTLDEVVSTVVDQFVGPPVTKAVDAELAGRYFSQPVLNAAQHVVQESLTNVLRHATEASRVKVDAHVHAPDQVEITVSNDGGRVDTEASGGFGLVGLTERVEAAGGQLSAGPTATGWRVRAVLPLSSA